MNQLNDNLYHLSIEQLCQLVTKHFPIFNYDFKKHVILLKDDDHNTIGTVRLPLHFMIDDKLKIISNSANILYASIESGYAAINMMQGQDSVYHTTFGAYTTRKKQGFSQVKYLNKKGKSRAGSRVRLASKLEFFEKINESLTDLLITYDIDRFALNCSTSLIPYLHQSKVKCPFEKTDLRLYKIPLHIQQSNFTNLEAAIKKLKAPILSYEDKNRELMKPFNQHIINS
ncbi:MAG: hypothetical protein AB8B73_06995 [Ekhidna sp.]